MFKKGVSGNPGGRPKEFFHIRDLAQAKTPEAFQVVIRTMRDSSNPELALKAANIIIERGYGKPIQEISGIENTQVIIMNEIKKDEVAPRYNFAIDAPSNT